MNTSKHTPGQPCACCILLRTGEPLESRHGEQPCSDISHIELCPKHAAAPAMYEALQTLVEYLSAQVPADTLDDWKHVFAARQALAQAEGKHS